MSYLATVYKVMIASPSDAANEQQIARNIIHKWNTLNSEDKKIVLLPIAWNTNTAPEMGAHPQEIIDKRILKETDILVGIFLHRLGTPTLDAQSGTAHEIGFHIKAKKPTMIYFLKDNINPDKFNKDQYDKLMAFKEDMGTKGFLHECDMKNFESNFLDHLTLMIIQNEYIETNKIELKIANLDDYDGADIDISNEAKQIIIEALKDKTGYIYQLRDSGGTTIQTNGKNMIPSQDARSVAKWRHALNELLENGLTEDKGNRGEVFTVTHKGYEYADNLEKEIDYRKNTFSVSNDTSSTKEDDLKFDKNTGTYITQKNDIRYCSKCLNSSSSNKVPLTERENGWKCEVCDKFYSNPNYNPPPSNPYKKKSIPNVI